MKNKNISPSLYPYLSLDFLHPRNGDGKGRTLHLTGTSLLPGLKTGVIHQLHGPPPHIPQLVPHHVLLITLHEDSFQLLDLLHHEADGLVEGHKQAPKQRR